MILTVHQSYGSDSPPENLRFQHIGAAQGLSHNTVTSVMQDSRGFMWFGTVDGLNRFDGYQCKVFRHDPQDPDTLPSNFIHGIYQDRQGNLWVSTRDGGLAVMFEQDRLRERFTRFPHDPNNPQSLSHPKVQGIYQDHQDRIWVGTTGGLNRFIPETGTFVHLRLQPGGTPLVIRDILQDKQNILWVGTESGLASVKFTGSEESAEKPHIRMFRHDPKDPTSLSSSTAQSLFVDHQQRLWVGTRGGGLNLFFPKTGSFKHYRHHPEDPRSLSENSVTVTHQDEWGRLWLGTGHGLDLFDPENGSFTHFRHSPSRSDSISNNNVGGTYQSAGGDGATWLTTWGGGVNKLITDDRKFQTVKHDPDNNNSPSGNFIFSFCEDRFGDIWVGTIGFGLSILDRKSGRWTRFLNHPDQPEGLSHNSIWQIVEDRSGTVWVCTEDGGLNAFSRETHATPFQITHYRHNPKDPASLPSDNVKALLEDQNGNLWIGLNGTGLGFQREHDRPKGPWRHYRHNPENLKSLSDGGVQILYQDRSGVLWAGTTEGGINRIDYREDSPMEALAFTSFQQNPSDPTSLGNNDVRAIMEDRMGRMWLGTYGGGLNRFHRDSGQFTRFTEQQGLSNDFVYGVLEAQNGDLWLSTNRGLSRFRPSNATFVNYTVLDGLQSDEFNSGAYLKTKDGKLFFGGVNGFNSFFPQDLDVGPPETNAQLTLTAFKKMGKATLLDQALPELKQLDLDPKDRFFSLEWALLDFRDPGKHRFSYRLEGFDEQWVDNGQRRFVSYSNLDPGQYRFHYRGTNGNGVTSQGRPVTLIVHPAFWQTWWFRLLVLLGLAFLCWGAVALRKVIKEYRRTKYVGHFKILRRLGSGGSGTVYQAFDKNTRRTVALKILNEETGNSPESVRRFLQEAEIGRRLRHPNIVDLYEAGSNEHVRFITMEYLAGKTLAKFICDHHPLEEPTREKIARQILTGLQAIHEQGVVHRDLKSANIMVLPDGSVKIMDFGLARISTLTTVNNRDQLMGTLAYMSPEQTVGKDVDLRSDLYAFGVILYEMTFATLPFQAQNEMELIFAIHNESPNFKTKPHCGGAWLLPIMERCLAKDPSLRFQTVSETVAVLNAAPANTSPVSSGSGCLP